LSRGFRVLVGVLHQQAKFMSEDRTPSLIDKNQFRMVGGGTPTMGGKN